MQLNFYDFKPRCLILKIENIILYIIFVLNEHEIMLILKQIHFLILTCNYMLEFKS